MSGARVVSWRLPAFPTAQEFHLCHLCVTYYSTASLGIRVDWGNRWQAQIKPLTDLFSARVTIILIIKYVIICIARSHILSWYVLKLVSLGYILKQDGQPKKRSIDPYHPSPRLARLPLPHHLKAYSWLNHVLP